jgi:Fur family transcriptional regulator, ferric uptake regulator
MTSVGRLLLDKATDPAYHRVRLILNLRRFGSQVMLDGVQAVAGPQWADHARDVLQRAGHHKGAARERLIELLGRQDCALSAFEIEEALRRRTGTERSVGRASVYRALELLRDHGLIKRLDLGDGVARYELADPAGEHHHHLVCENCGRLVAFDDPALERAIDDVSERLGVRVQHHEVVLRGACADCD